MNIYSNKVKSEGFKFVITDGDLSVGRGYLYLMYNDRHKEPFGLLENIFVEEKYRTKGYGTALIKHIVSETKKLGCYKLIATSRDSNKEVHKFYEKLGFMKHGLEYRINLLDVEYPSISEK